MDPAPKLGEIAEFIQQTAEQMRRFGLSTVDVDHNGTRIKIRISATRESVKPSQVAPETAAAADELADQAAEPDGHDISAPMIGTFFAAASPDDAPFVEVGDVVEAGQTVGIIEAMKIMNEITADRSGTISQIYVNNAQAVEYGQRLMRIVSDSE